MADAQGVSIVIDDTPELERIDPVTGTVETDQADGGVVVQLDAKHTKQDKDDDDWFCNLADEIGGPQLATIAGDLVDAIEEDDRSRAGYLDTRARGYDLLGIKLENPSASVGDGGEGMSKVTNPLLLEALLKGWANAQAEMLPANGPLKVRNEGDETTEGDERADTLERDLNHWFTKTAAEYYPDTSHMLLWGTYFGGSGFKKVYRCPMRRRPVSESVDAKDLIVSDTTKDLRACARITHYIPLRPSIMRRMQMIGAYRDIDLAQPTEQSNAVDEKIAGIQGTHNARTRPEDQSYNLWETQCELDLDEFIPDGSDFKGEGIPLPYLVTLDKDSREILAIRRDWDKEDDQCERRRMYVKYPYVPGPGFYGTGMLNILGNASAAMTAAWREALDAGMYANFPGGLIAKMGARQNTSTFRVAPGEFVPIETSNNPISQVVMGMPYKDVTPGLLSLIDKVLAQAQAVGGTADIPTAEGIQNVPVGTMLAQIEQATKVVAAAHKGMHQAQSEEFDLIINLFRENPDDFVRGNKAMQARWTADSFIAAIGNYNLVPVSDPNVPSHIHRVSKALALVQLIAVPAFAPLMNAKETLLRCLRVIREDPNGLVQEPPPQQAQASPEMMKAQASMATANANLQRAQIAAAQIGQEGQLKSAEMALQKQIADTNLQREMIIHQADQVKIGREHQMEQERMAHERDMAHRGHALEVAKAAHGASIAQHGATLDQHAHALDVATAGHDAHMAHREHELAVYEAKHPPTPARGK